MTILDLIEQYKKQLENNPNDYNCLLFALQIPSICSRIEFPQTPENTGNEKGKLYNSYGNPRDANLYKTWLMNYSDSFFNIYNLSMELNDFCNVMYKLRCQITHEGILMSDNNQFYFINGDDLICIGNKIFLPIKCLCESLFNAAMISIKRNKNIDITPFEEFVMSDNICCQIRNDVKETYKPFWSNYSEDDKLLNYIYKCIIFDNSDMKQEIDEFFKNQPNKNFEILNFGMNFSYIYDAKQRFIKQRYDDLGRYIDVLSLSKADYEKMLQVHQEFESFSKMNPFDITKYYKKLQ